MSVTETGDDRFSSEYIDLLSERVGGKALSCSDEWFAECASLVKPGRGVFKEGHFVSTGQWMDGWESRRSFDRARFRPEGGLDHDWCILRLGIRGVIRGVDIDTNHFKGNAPEFASVEAAFVEGDLDENTQWHEVLPKSPTNAHSQNLFEINDERVWTHVRLKMYPDGGIARFRVYGEAHINKDNFIEGELIDLASVMNGGLGLDCSDRFFSSPSNLLMPGRGVNMGDGWETKRRRDENNDWSIVKLGLSGTIRKVIVDTAHFKGNFPDRFSLEATSTDRDDITAEDISWQTVIAETALYADQEHIFIDPIQVSVDEKFTHVRLNIYPDGGISRLRILGFPNWS
jgi:allantoicase